MMKCLLYTMLIIYAACISGYTLHAQVDTTQSKAFYKTFLAHPLKSFTVIGGWSGCYGGESKSITFNKKGNSFESEFLAKKGRGNITKNAYKNKISARSIKNILAYVDSNPLRLPRLEEFGINNSNNLQSQKTLDSIFNEPSCIVSTMSKYFRVILVNEQNDSITIHSSTFVNAKPNWLPWSIINSKQWYARDQKCFFESYSVPFSQLINSCLPQNFPGKKAFSNQYLLQQIANYRACDSFTPLKTDD